MNPILAFVRTKLDGYEQRQAQRDLARQFHNRVYAVQRARRGGELQLLSYTLRWLSEREYEYTTSSAFKVTTVHVKVGVKLVYDPSGNLSYLKRPRYSRYDTVEMWPAMIT